MATAITTDVGSTVTFAAPTKALAAKTTTFSATVNADGTLTQGRGKPDNDFRSIAYY